MSTNPQNHHAPVGAPTGVRSPQSWGPESSWAAPRPPATQQPLTQQPFAPQPLSQPHFAQQPLTQPVTAREGAAVAPRTPWLPLTATAAAAALAASLVTAGMTGAFDEDSTAPVSLAAVGSQEPRTVPVAAGAQPDWQVVADAVRASVVAIQVRTEAGGGQGSGVVIDLQGHVLTNEHVVGDAVEGGLKVTLFDGRVLDATIVGTDPTTDLAVVRLTDAPADISPAVLGDSDAVAVGAPVMAVGNPLGLDSTVTTGIVSALDRPVSTSDGADRRVVTNAIQVDAAVNPGNSGGPLFDAAGQVIGINSSIASMPNGAGGSSGSIGLGFAIPANLADRVATELIEDGAAEHAFLGVSLSDGTGAADGTVRRGAVVEQVTPGSPAAEAGLRPGDVVVAIDGDAVSGAEALTGLVRERAVGTEVTVTVVRDGEGLDIPVTLVVRDESAVPAPRQDRGATPRGLSPEELPDLFGR